MNLKWKVSRVSVSIAGRPSASTRPWNQYLCTTTVVLGWTQDEHFLEDDLLLDSGFGSSMTKMGPQMECWVGGCTGRTLPCIQSLQGTALVLVIDGAPTPRLRSCNSQQPRCFKDSALPKW